MHARRRIEVVRTARVAMVIAAGSLAAAAGGCGPKGGAWLYNMGLTPKQKVTSEYKLPSGPLLILVDDDQDLVQPPLARQMLVDAIAKTLREHKAVDRVTTNEEVARIRQTEPKFDQRGAREVGRLAEADTVLWLSVKQFSIPSDLEMSVASAHFTVTLKVVNAKAEKREDVRLWPMDRDGRVVAARLTPNEVHACKTTAEAHEAIATKLADEIAKLFYDYEIER